MPAGTDTATPQSRPGHAAPVSATVAASRATTTRPPKVISTAAAPSGLPTSRFAKRSAARSAAPLRPTPIAA